MSESFEKNEMASTNEVRTHWGLAVNLHRREKRLAESYGLDFDLDAKKPGTVTGIEAQTNNKQEANNADADDE